MPHAKITQINIVAKDFDATARFYRQLGFDVPEPTPQPPGALHAEADAGPVRLAIDNEHLAGVYHAAARRHQLHSRAILGVTLAGRAEVDETYERLVAAGYQGLQRPYNAFWGSRYAIVADPDGNHVGLMSPPAAEHGSWPPVNSPD
jgi:catechol 2,3-dioxygenase-like lactoylglutathione lyase family enzyme